MSDLDLLEEISHAVKDASMCNSYRIKPKRGADKGVIGRVADAVAKLPSSLVRKSDPGNPEICAVYTWYQKFMPEAAAETAS